MKKLKVNKKLLIDALIAAIIVDNAPNILNTTIFKSNPLSGIALTGAGAGAGLLVGMIMKKPDIGTLSIAFAASEIVNNLVAGLIGTQGSTADYLALQSSNGALREYIEAPTVQSASSYKDDYMRSM